MAAPQQALLAVASVAAGPAYAFALASADTALGAGYTDITGCSLSLTAGTWLVIASASVQMAAGSTDSQFVKIYNSTDAVDYSGTKVTSPSGFNRDQTIQAVITLAGTKTITFAGRRQSVAATALRYSDGTIPGTYIHAISLG